MENTAYIREFEGMERDAPRARPGRRKRKRKFILGMGPRIAILSLAVVASMIALCAFVTKIAQPYAMQRQQAVQVRALKTQLVSEDASNESLQRQIDYLRRPDGVATAARAQGFTRPGEVSIEINAKPVASADGAQEKGFAGMIQRAWQHWTRRS